MKTPTFLQTVIFALILVAMPLANFAKDYHFLGSEDRMYVNPKNWYPAYPGTQIQEGDRIIIEGSVVYEGFMIDLAGTMEISLGSTVISADGEMLIRPTGKLSNFGELKVRGIRNFGRFINNVSSSTHLNFFSAQRAAISTNMASASLTTTGDLVNAGTFNNYGTCSVGHDLFNLNASIFNQMQHATLKVRGAVQTSPDSSLNHGPSSTFQTAKEIALQPGSAYSARR